VETQAIPYYDSLPDFLKVVKSIDATNRCFVIYPFEQFGGPGEVIPPFRSNTYVAALVTEGNGTIHLDGLPYAVSSGTLYFLRPWTLRSLRKDDQWHGYILMFTPEFVARRSVLSDPMREHPFYRRGAHPLIQISQVDTHQLALLFEQLRTEFTNPDLQKTERHELLYHLLQVLLIKSRAIYQQALSATSHTHPVSLVESFQTLIQTYYMENGRTLPTVHAIAQQLHIHPHYLSDILKKYTGKTALQHIRERTVLEAQTLLRNTNLTVAEIGYQLQFDDPSNFTKFFKHLTGVTPRAYREQEQGVFVTQ